MNREDLSREFLKIVDGEEADLTIPDIIDPYPVPPGNLGRLVEDIYRNAACESKNSSIAAAVGIVAHAASNSLFCSNIYTNQYILIVGDKGSGKSTAFNYAKEVFRRVGYSWSCIGSPGSDEAIYTNLSANKQEKGKANLAIVSDELKGLFAKMNQKQGPLAGLESTMNELYTSGGSVYQGKVNKHAKSIPQIDSPCLSILGAIQPASLALSLRADLKDSGLLSRMLPFFIPPVSDEWGSHLKFRKSRLHVDASLTHRISILTKMKLTEVHVTEDGEAAINAAMRKQHDSEVSRTGQPAGAMDGHYVELLVGVAMCAAAMDIDITTQAFRVPPLTPVYIKWAQDLIAMCQNDFSLYLNDSLHENVYEGKIKKVLSFIRKSGQRGCLYSRICKHNTTLSERDIDEALIRLGINDEITMYERVGHSQSKLKFVCTPTGDIMDTFSYSIKTYPVTKTTLEAAKPAKE